MLNAKILLIDDHAMFRTGLRMVLNSGLPDAQIVEAGSLNHALHHAPEMPDIVLLDIKMPGLSGVEGIALLKRKWPQVPVLMLSSQDEPETVHLAMTRGAAGFISKVDTADHIVEVVVRILQGEFTEPLIQALHHENLVDAPTHLTPRQCEVLELLNTGMSNKLIAKHLSLSENTVRVHVQGILEFLQVSGRSEAVFVARQRGLLG